MLVCLPLLKEKNEIFLDVKGSEKDIGHLFSSKCERSRGKKLGSNKYKIPDEHASTDAVVLI